jgi:cob(I)alamin adenosyltransferase
VEAYGSIDELNAALGFARSITKNGKVSSWSLDIQKSLFRLGSALATPSEAQKGVRLVTEEDVSQLTSLVHTIEAREGILSDWSLPGASTEAAAFEVARTVCRRAERSVVRLIENGTGIPAQVLAYINRCRMCSGSLAACSNSSPESIPVCETNITRGRDGRKPGDTRSE